MKNDMGINIMLFMLGVLFFGSGLHNIDMAHNMSILNCELGINIIDHGPIGTTQDAKTGYFTGFLYMFGSLMLMIYAFIATFSLAYDGTQPKRTD